MPRSEDEQSESPQPDLPHAALATPFVLAVASRSIAISLPSRSHFFSKPLSHVPDLFVVVFSCVAIDVYDVMLHQEVCLTH